MILKTWYIRQCGWATYFKEVSEFTRGREDVRVECTVPMIISIAEVIND